MERVVITGIGAICANASDASAFVKACGDGISGIKPCTVFHAEHLMTELFGEVCDIKAENRLY